MMGRQTTMVKRTSLPQKTMVAALTMCLLSLGALGTTAKPAEAAFPGENGKIAFASKRDGNLEIYTMDPDGSNPINLSNNSALDSGPVFSPDGTKIAFASRRDGNDEIYVMNSDGTNPINLSNNSSADDYNPAFSPDGDKIAFERYDGAADDEEIFVMRSDGNDQKNLSNNPSASDSGPPSFSADGTKVAFTSRRDGNPEIYTVDAADGSNPTRLTSNTVDDADPSFSPDGTKIAFMSKRDGNPELYTVDAADGSNPTRLTNDPLGDFLPSFSPDGSKITFTSNRDGNSNTEIYVTGAANGTSSCKLTNNSAFDSQPNWGTSSGQLPPSVFCSAPSSGQSGVARNISPTISFSEEMSPNTLTSSNVKLYERVKKKIRRHGKVRRVWRWVPVSASVSCDNPCQAATLDPHPSAPSALLAAGRLHAVVVSTEAKDKAGNALAQNFSSAFTTGSS